MKLDSISGSSKANNAEFFATDISLPQSRNDAILKIVLAMATAATFDITFDSGSNWIKANGGNQLPATVGAFLEIPIIGSDLFNMRQTSGSTVTVTECRVHI